MDRRCFLNLAASAPLRPHTPEFLFRLCSAIATIEAVPCVHHNPGGLMQGDRLLTFRNDAEGAAMLYRAASRHVAHGKTLRQFVDSWAPLTHEEYLQKIAGLLPVNPDRRLWDYLRIELL